MPGNTLTRRRRARGQLAAALLVFASCAALAAPDETPDPIADLVAQKHLVARVQDKASEMVLAAMNFLDVPYRRGGNGGDDGFDCSGFTRHIFGLSLGMTLPRRVDEQATAPGLVKVDRSQLQPGDLVFFNTLKRTFSHVGIYIGEGRFIHSPRSGGQVRVEDMRFAYWSKRYTGARRAEPLLASATPAAAAFGDATAPAANPNETARVVY